MSPCEPRDPTLPVRAICVASGKGGVGKSHISVNLALALARKGQQVMLFDADLGLANVDVILGLQVHYTLAHVLQGECTLEEAIIPGPFGVRVVPASSGVRQMANLGMEECGGLVSAFSELRDLPDVLIVDLAAGISDAVVTFCRASHDVVVVVCDEPTALADAYALIKVLSRDHQVQRFHILANRIQSHQDGRALFSKLVKVTDQFLDVTLDYIGEVPEDPQISKALKDQRALMELYPSSRAAEAFRRLASQIDRWPLRSAPSGHVQFFVERLVQQFSEEATQP